MTVFQGILRREGTPEGRGLQQNKLFPRDPDRGSDPSVFESETFQALQIHISGKSKCATRE